jgi:2-keto-4-pentenoate hydratase/2-oxohepta-3-ene-1,7-dioic acid hydratase in catechol pathway
VQYCRFQTEHGPQYGEVGLRQNEWGQNEWWMERVIAPPSEDRSVTGVIESFPAQTLSSLTLLPPVTPSKIVCIGRNYRDHAAELGNEAPKEPLLFLKPPSSLLPPGGTIRLPAISQHVDYEGELGIVIGCACHKLHADEDVNSYIRGYVIVNDVTARDLQKSDGQWSRAKGFDTFCPVGPIVSDAIDPDAGVAVTTRLNGTVKQHGNTKDLIFNIATLLRYISAAMTLNPGDLIPTGTPAGVGPVNSGDVVEVEIDGLGVLRNPVLAEND